MAPKKMKPASSSSQPVSKPTRATGRKRRLSDTSTTSEMSTASASATTATKRQKKAKKIEEVILEEDDEELPADAGAIEGEDIEHDGFEETIDSQAAQDKHVHFGSTANGDDVEEIATATHNTPHPGKMSLIKRRITASPGTSKRVKTTIRSSLPPHWSSQEETATLTQTVPTSQEFNFAPLNEVLQDRIRQRKSISSIDRDVESHSNDDMLVLEREPDVAYPELSTPQRGQSLIRSLFSWSTNGRNGSPVVDSKSLVHQNTTTTERVSLGTTAQAEWDLERRKLQDAIVALSRDANDAKTRYQVLEMELQGLGFGEEDADVQTIIESIRESFIHVRVSLEEQLILLVPEEASSHDILEIVISNVREFAKRLRIQSEEVEQKTELIADLGSQIQGLLNRLADAKIRDAELEQVNVELDQDLDARSIRILSLEEQVTLLTAERDILLEQLRVKRTEAQSLGQDYADTLKSVEKLQSSLEHYRSEERKLTLMITTLEKSHSEVIASMNKEREETVSDLEDRLDEEKTSRGQFEIESGERQEKITELETELDTLDEQYDKLQKELIIVKTERDTERVGRLTTETALQEKTEDVEDLEDRVNTLEGELVTLNVQITELRASSKTQRTQLEVTETDLDARSVEVSQLNEKLQAAGKTANELRGKLYEVQQQHQKEIKELNALMLDRDEQFQSDMTLEVTRREKAEKLAQEHSTTINSLKIQLVKIETSMEELIVERDERIVALEGMVADKVDEIAILRTDLSNVETQLATYKSRSHKEVKDLKSSITILQQTITQHVTTITQLEQSEINTSSLHDSEIDDRNATIAQLHVEVTSHKRKVADLEAEKAGLERRVEQEAEQMLELQNEKFDEIAALKATILDKQHKIQVVETKAIEADRRWEEVLEARDEEISELRTEMKTTSSSTMEATTMMQSAFATLLTKFKEHIRRSSAVNADLRAKINAIKGIADGEGEALLGEGEAAIEEIEAMDVVGQMQAFKSVVTTTTTTAASRSLHSESHAPRYASQSSSAQGSAKKAVRGRGRQKRLQDSGVSIEAEEELA